jgi:outer membrane protein assembly factor BamB
MLGWLLALAAFAADSGENVSWPVFRGNGQSQAASQSLPLTWSADKNVAWSVDLAGYGQSSPVVWGKTIFAGETEWSKTFPTSTKITVSDYVSRSAPTPAVDAERVYAFFESGDVIALDHAGNELWKRSLTKDYGAIEGNHGLGSSPALTENAVIVLLAHAGPSCLVALDKKTGETLWKTDREPKVFWSSPVVVGSDAGQQILLNSNGLAEAFSAKDGKRIWWVTGLEGNTVASPSVADDLVIIGSSQVGNNLAIRRGGEGDVTETHIAWRSKEATSSFASPLVHKGRAYFVNRSGGLVAVDAKTGETLWKGRLPGSCWASPVSAGERAYFFTNTGTTVVLDSGDKMNPLAENTLPGIDRIYGVALVEDRILIRTGSKLICIREAKP